MKTLTLLPFLLAFAIAVAAMPTNVYHICAWNAGTLKVDPWRRKTAAAVRRVAQSIRAWLASLCTPRLAFGCLAVLLVLVALQWSGGHEGVLAAVTPAVATLQSKRAQLLREAEALKSPNGTFKDDATRAAFDAKMSEVEAVDAELRTQPSETIAERDPLDPGAPLAGSQPPRPQPTDRDLGAAAERDRCQKIIAGCRSARLPNEFADRLIQDNVSLADAQTRILEELGRRDNATAGPSRGPSGVTFGDDPFVHVRAGIENAIMHRIAPSLVKLTDAGQMYRGMTLLDTARVFLQARGIRVTGMSKMELAGAALGLSTRAALHTTSDFANLLADVANKTLRRAYDEAPATYRAIGRQAFLPDFKPAKRLQLGEAPELKQVLENGEFTRGTIGEGKEQYQLATYGRVFGISRQALVNDDTDAFGRVTTLFGRSARDLESDLVWAQITANGNMGDGVALFHATHNNLAGVGAVISVATLGAGRAAMRKQKGLDGKQKLNIVPISIVTPPEIETTADQFVTQNLLASAPGSVNPFAGKLQVISEPRLSDNSTTAWYLAASPSQIDIIEYALLEGETGPVVESRIGFDIDGVEIKCRHDFAAKVLDYRGLYKNPGA